MKLLIGLLFLVYPQLGSALCVLEKHAHLRHGPSTKYPITFEAIQYTPLEKISKQSGWYRVKDVDGDIHWIREDIVTSKYQCVTIKEEFANLRKGPGVSYAKVAATRGDKYLSFRLLVQKGDWVKVEDAEGDQLWLQKKLVWVR